MTMFVPQQYMPTALAIPRSTGRTGSRIAQARSAGHLSSSPHRAALLRERAKTMQGLEQKLKPPHLRFRLSRSWERVLLCRDKICSKTRHNQGQHGYKAHLGLSKYFLGPQRPEWCNSRPIGAATSLESGGTRCRCTRKSPLPCARGRRRRLAP